MKEGRNYRILFTVRKDCVFFQTLCYLLVHAVYSHQGTAGNIPLAAAFSLVPIAVMAVYIYFAKKLGAFNAL